MQLCRSSMAACLLPTTDVGRLSSCSHNNRIGRDLQPDLCRVVSSRQVRSLDVHSS